MLCSEGVAEWMMGALLVLLDGGWMLCYRMLLGG